MFILGPRIQSVVINFSGSRLNVEYKLLDTGGYHWDDVAVTIACDILENFSEDLGSADSIMMEDYGFYYQCTEECLDETLMGSYEFAGQTVYAGIEYQCLVIATNNEPDRDISGDDATSTEGVKLICNNNYYCY